MLPKLPVRVEGQAVAKVQVLSRERHHTSRVDRRTIVGETVVVTTQIWARVDPA